MGKVTTRERFTQMSIGAVLLVAALTPALEQATAAPPEIRVDYVLPNSASDVCMRFVQLV